MSRYDVSPSGVEEVLRAVQADAERFDAALEPLDSHLAAVAAGTAGSGAILPALDAFFAAKSTELTRIGTRVSASVQGAVNAVNAYVSGDLDMIGDYQRQAARDAVGEAGPGRAERQVR